MGDDDVIICYIYLHIPPYKLHIQILSPQQHNNQQSITQHQHLSLPAIDSLDSLNIYH